MWWDENTFRWTTRIFFNVLFPLLLFPQDTHTHKKALLAISLTNMAQPCWAHSSGEQLSKTPYWTNNKKNVYYFFVRYSLELCSVLRTRLLTESVQSVSCHCYSISILYTLIYKYTNFVFLLVCGFNLILFSTNWMERTMSVLFLCYVYHICVCAHSHRHPYTFVTHADRCSCRRRRRPFNMMYQLYKQSTK